MINIFAGNHAVFGKSFFASIISYYAPFHERKTLLCILFSVLFQWVWWVDSSSGCYNCYRFVVLYSRYWYLSRAFSFVFLWKLTSHIQKNTICNLSFPGFLSFFVNFHLSEKRQILYFLQIKVFQIYIKLKLNLTAILRKFYINYLILKFPIWIIKSI